MAQGQAHAEMRSPGRSLENLDAAAVRIDEFGHHRKPDPGALDVAALGRFPLVEGFEDAIALLERYPGARIEHVEHQLLALAPGLDRDRASARGELDRSR